MKLIAILLLTIATTSSAVYADDLMSDPMQSLSNDQIIATNTNAAVSGLRVTGKDANGTPETAIMDQNGRWHVPGTDLGSDPLLN